MKRIFYFLSFLILWQLNCSLLPQKTKINIEYSPGAVTVITGQDKTVEVTITPQEVTGSLAASYVSENIEVATVDFSQSTVIVHGKKAGTTRVLSKIAGYSDFSFLVTVVDSTSATNSVQKYITSPKTTISIDTGHDTTITAELINGTPVEQNGLHWTASNPNIFTITGTGTSAIVTPVSPGSAEISISHPSAINTFTIYVKVNDAGSSISLSATGISLDVGGECQLKAYIPKASAAELNSITWSTVPETQNMITILGRGESVTLLGNNPGSVTVTARAPAGSAASCDVVVKEPKALILSPSILPLKVGDSGKITISKTPANMALTVNSTNPSIVTFCYDRENDEITVTALKEGTTSIQVTGGGLMTKTDCTVTQDRFFELDSQAINCQPDQAASLHYSVLPADENITWTVADPDVATISVNTAAQTVNITPQAEGTTTLTGRTAAGITRTANLNIWYSNIQINYAGAIIGGNSSQYAREKTYLDMVNLKIGLGDAVRFQVDLSFPQKGLRLNGPVVWTKSADFDKEIQMEELNSGRCLILTYKPGWTAHEQYKDGGTLSFTVNYGNGKSYTLTFALRIWIQIF